jgi:hypothetical protein
MGEWGSGRGEDKGRCGRNGRYVFFLPVSYTPCLLVHLQLITVLSIVFLTVDLAARAILLTLNARPLACSEFTA